jgi:hypothetical protein
VLQVREKGRGLLFLPGGEIRRKGVKMKTKVIFRTWADGTVTAFFPEIPADVAGMSCLSYEHIGQHGGADYHFCTVKTKPSTFKEAQPLFEELKGIGYDMKIVYRETPADRENRLHTS